MPRGRKAAEQSGNGTDNQIPQKARPRKKKDSSSVCGTPTGDKLEHGGMLCQNIVMEQMVGSGPCGPPFHIQGMQQHGSNTQFLGPPEENLQQPPSNGMQMQQHFVPPPHPDFFYNQQHQVPFPPPPVYSMPLQPPISNPHGQGQFQESDVQQFMFHPQPSPVPQPPPPAIIPQQIRPHLGLFPFPLPPFFEYRIQEMNRRFYCFTKQSYDQQSASQFWDAFATEFFDDFAKMTIITSEPSENNVVGQHFTRKYSIGRILIPRFYKTLFESGVSELRYSLRTTAKEHVQQVPGGGGMTALECNDVLVVTKHVHPIMSEIHTQCQLFIEFSAYEPNFAYRITNWMIKFGDSNVLLQYMTDGNIMENNANELFKKFVSRSGLPFAVVHYLKMCSILEPMMGIMDRSISSNISPREALKQFTFDHFKRTQPHLHQNMMPIPVNPSPVTIPVINQSMYVQNSGEPPPEDVNAKKAPRKRTRKNATATNAPTTGMNTSSKKKNAGQVTPPIMQQPNFTPNFPASTTFQQNPYNQDVLTVGEPALMGNDFGEQDERPISRIENSAYLNRNANPVMGIMRSSPHSLPQSHGMMMPHQQQMMSIRCNPGIQGQQMGVMSGPLMSVEHHPQMLMNDFDMNSIPSSNPSFQ